MHWQSIVLLVVIALGGIAVIGSYVVGLKGKAGASDAAWGGVPAKVRPLYGVSMILSAIGFLAVLYYIFLELAPDDVVIGSFGFYIFFPIFVVILVPSVFWLPLSKYYLQKPGAGRFAAVQVVLLLVGLASIALAWALFALEVESRAVAFGFAAVGACYFAFHTFVLDALVWTALFRRPQKQV